MTADLKAQLGQLVGSWAFERTISGQGEMSGLAVFAVSADDLLSYREDGQFKLGTGSYAFTRSYLYRFRRDGVDVLFDETYPRLFQSVDLTAQPTKWVGEGHHLCAADTYASRYEFALPTSFSITHSVNGPRKNYVSHTHFVRHAG
jgi:hypothetical protein